MPDSCHPTDVREAARPVAGSSASLGVRAALAAPPPRGRCVYMYDVYSPGSTKKRVNVETRLSGKSKLKTLTPSGECQTFESCT